MAVTLALLTAAALPACGGARDALTIYSGRGGDLVGPLLERFNEETGIPIDVRYGDSAELALLIAEEGDQTPADVFFSQSPGAVGFLAEAGRLARLPEDTLAAVDPRFGNADGLWVGLSGRQRVLVYNTAMVDEAALPDSVFDVAEGPLAGEVAVAPTNGSFQDFVTAMRQLEGDDAAAAWLGDLAAAGAPSYPNNNAIVEAVSRGEVTMGLVNHYYGYRFLEEDPALPIANHLFPGDDVGSLLIPATISVLEGTGKADEAAELVDFLLAEAAQRYFAEETFEYPLAAGVGASEELPPLETLDVFPYDFDSLGGGLEATIRLIGDSGLGQ